MKQPESLSVENVKYIREDLIETFTPDNSEFWSIGQKYYIRTVTHHYTGQLVKKDENNIYLKNAAWIADSGRWANALSKGELKEVEPYPEGDIICVNWGAGCDASIWKHKLPRDVK